MLPCTDEGRKASDGPEEHSTVLMVLGTNECSNDGRPDRCVVMSESFDISDAETGDRRRPLWGACRHVRRELIKAQGVLAHPLIINKVVTNDDVHDCEHQRNVGPWKGLQKIVVIAVCSIGGDRLHWINHDEACPGCTCFFNRGPQVAVGETGVGSPQHDETRVLDFHRVETLAIAIGHRQSGTDGGATDISQKTACADVIEET